MTTLPFYIFLFIHLTSLVVGFGSVLVIDFFGLRWMLKKSTLAFTMQVAEVTQKLIWLGWSGLVLSGIGLIVIKGYIDELTWIKLFFVVMLGVNGYLMHLIKKNMERLGDAESVPRSVMFRMGFSTVLSQLGWWGAMIIGFLHRHWQHTISWPPHPFFVIGLLALAMIVVGVIGYRINNPSAPPLIDKGRLGGDSQ